MKSLETENIVFKVLEERIFSFYIKDFKSATKEDGLKTVKWVADYYKKYPLTKVGMTLVEFGLGASIEKEAREFASTKAANTRTHGAAILVKNLAQQLIGDYYLRFNHPRYPTKVFYKKEKALAWIKTKLAYYDTL